MKMTIPFVYFGSITPQTKVPDDTTHIIGQVFFDNCKRSASLPVGLRVIIGDVDLTNSKMELLPQTLETISGSLQAYNSSLRHLPESLQVIGGDCEIRRSCVVNFPESFVCVGGSLKCSNITAQNIIADIAHDGPNADDIPF